MFSYKVQIFFLIAWYDLPNKIIKIIDLNFW